MSKRKSYTFEYFFKAKPELIYNYISASYNLSVWFADKVTVENDVFHFHWNSSVESARMYKQAFKKKVAFQWLERPGEEHLIFQIDNDEITGETVLSVTDFDDEDQIGEAKMMWDGAIDKLKKLIGG